MQICHWLSQGAHCSVSTSEAVVAPNKPAQQNAHLLATVMVMQVDSGEKTVKHHS